MTLGRLHQSERDSDGAASNPAACRPRAVSAVEREPAQLVAQPLVVEHEVADLVGQLVALPLALQAAGLLARRLRALPLGRP